MRGKEIIERLKRAHETVYGEVIPEEIIKDMVERIIAKRYERFVDQNLTIQEANEAFEYLKSTKKASK